MSDILRKFESQLGLTLEQTLTGALANYILVATEVGMKKQEPQRKETARRHTSKLLLEYLQAGGQWNGLVVETIDKLSPWLPNNQETMGTFYEDLIGLIFPFFTCDSIELTANHDFNSWLIKLITSMSEKDGLIASYEQARFLYREFLKINAIISAHTKISAFDPEEKLWPWLSSKIRN